MTKKQKKLFTGIILLLTAVIILLAYLLVTGRNTSGGVTLDKNATAANTDTDTADTGQIQIPGYDKLVFRADETDQQMTLYNPEGNPCYFTFSLYIDEEKDPIYKSDMVAPGTEIQNITLSRTLPKGTYELHINIDTCDLDTQTPLNSAISSAELSVE